MQYRSFINGVVATSVGALLWGFSGTCSQFLYANYDINANFITLSRSVSASIAFLIVIFALKRDTLSRLAQNKRDVLRLLVFGLSLYAVQFTYLMSVSFTNAGTATVLQSSYMAIVVLYTCLRFRQKPLIADILAMIFAAAAVWIIATQGNLDTLRLPLGGLIFGILSAFAAAAYIICPKKLANKYGSMTITGLGVVLSAVMACITWFGTGLVTGQMTVPPLDAAGWIALIGGTGICGTFIAFTLFMFGVSIIGQVKGSVLGTFEPLGAMLFSMLWMGTVFSAADWIGFVLMLVMLVLVAVPGKQKAAAGESQRVPNKQAAADEDGHRIHNPHRSRIKPPSAL